MISRRKFIGLMSCGTFLSTCGYSVFIEPNQFDETFYRLTKNDEVDSILIAQLSDLHLNKITEFHHRIAQNIYTNKPNLIVISGDSLDSINNEDFLIEFLKLLPLETQKLAVLGNWEHWARINIAKLMQVYDDFNCKLLVNQSFIYKTSKSQVQIVGLDDFTAGVPDYFAAIKDTEENKNVIVLQHSPEYFDKVYSRPHKGEFFGSSHDKELPHFDLMISGHTHGGQIRFFGLAPFTPQGSGDYLNGWYKKQDRKLYVSRGLGTSIIPVRFMSKPELTYFHYSLS